MSIEQKINYQLNKYPVIKKMVKRVYQICMYTISPKIKSEGAIEKISPDDKNHEYFFGYYDKSPWDKTDRYILCMRAKNTWSSVSPHEKADILIIDTKKDKKDLNRVKKIAETSAWNVQQGCMLQWLGPNFNEKILYNDCRNGKYVSIILTLATMEEKIISAPVYTVSDNGKTALTLDFSRLYELRPGYGYYNVPEKTKGIGLPDETAIWKIDLQNGNVTSLLKYTDFASFQPRFEMLEKGTIHKVNHIMLSPNGKRFMVLYRWFKGQRKYTRLITCNIDGSDMYVLSDDDMVSHCYWRDDEYILAFENKKKIGPGYYLMKDKTNEYFHCWPQFSNDGHPSYSPDRKMIVTDSYPNRARIASINIMDGNENKVENRTIARVFAPFKYDNDTRCDLHPRWNRESNKVCFDSVFEGRRGLYSVKVENENKINLKLSDKEKPKYTIITPMYNSFDLMNKYFSSLLAQNYKNFEVIIIDDFSSDGSYEKALKYSNNSELTIRVFRTDKNRGPGNARNIGIENARGEWITFIDNDDWIDDNFFCTIDDIISKENINCLIYDYYITNGRKSKISKSVYNNSSENISASECIYNVRNHAVGKVYKLSCLNKENVRYPLLRRCEDVAFVGQALTACGGGYYLPKPLYYYYQRKSSLSNNTNLDENDMVKAFSILEEKLINKYPAEIMQKSVTDLLYGSLLMMCKAGKSDEKIRNFIQDYQRKYPEWKECDIINYIGKFKKLFLHFASFNMIIALKILAYIHSLLIG